MRNNPLVSVIIPVYNRAAMVGQAIKSVLAQTYPYSEIIVVDGHSTDNTLEVLASFGGRISILQQTGKGIGNARNEGIAAAQGELIAFLDSDDYWLPRKLELQVRFLQRHPAIDLVHTDFRSVNQDGELIRASAETPLRLVSPAEFAQYEMVYNCIALSTVCLRQKVLPKPNTFDITIRASEDWNLWVQLLLQGCKFSYIPEVLAVYQVHLDALSFYAPPSFSGERIVEQALSQPLDFLKPEQARWVKQRAFTMKKMWAATNKYNQGEKREAAQHLQELLESYHYQNLPLEFLATFASLIPGFTLSPAERAQVELEAVEFAATALDFTKIGASEKQVKSLRQILVNVAKLRIYLTQKRRINLNYLQQILRANPIILVDNRLLKRIGTTVQLQLKARWRKAVYKISPR